MKSPALATLRLWLLLLLPFILWGTAMTAMTPLLETGGVWFVAGLRLLPAGAVLLVWVWISGRPLLVDRRDLGWFALFTLVDAACSRAYSPMDQTGAGLGSVLPIVSRFLLPTGTCAFLRIDNPVGWIDLDLVSPAFSARGSHPISPIGGCCVIYLL